MKEARIIRSLELRRRAKKARERAERADALYAEIMRLAAQSRKGNQEVLATDERR